MGGTNLTFRFAFLFIVCFVLLIYDCGYAQSGRKSTDSVVVSNYVVVGVYVNSRDATRWIESLKEAGIFYF